MCVTHVYQVQIGASLVAQMVKNLPAMQETQIQSLGPENSLEKGMATHSSILAWRIPWTEEPCSGLGVAKESDTTEQLNNTSTPEEKGLNGDGFWRPSGVKFHSQFRRWHEKEAVGWITVVPQRAVKATRRGTLNPTAEPNWGHKRETRMEVREPLMNCSPKSTPASAGLGSDS